MRVIYDKTWFNFITLHWLIRLWIFNNSANHMLPLFISMCAIIFSGFDHNTNATVAPMAHRYGATATTSPLKCRYNATMVPWQRHYGAMTTPLWCHDNITKAPWQHRYGAMTKPLWRHDNVTIESRLQDFQEMHLFSVLRLWSELWCAAIQKLHSNIRVQFIQKDLMMNFFEG